MYETLIAEKWLKATLEADSPLMAQVHGVYGYLAPETAEYPFVLFELAPGTNTNDTIGLGGTRIKTNLEYLVQVVSETNSFEPLSPIAERIDAVLHQKTGSVAGGNVLSCVRGAPYAEVEINEVSIKVYRHLGGAYLLQVQKA